jgi:hypothetical protein
VFHDNVIKLARPGEFCDALTEAFCGDNPQILLQDRKSPEPGPGGNAPQGMVS